MKIVNDADRLALDLEIQQVVSGRAADAQAASASQMYHLERVPCALEMCIAPTGGKAFLSRSLRDTLIAT